jgi:copper chaperone CopZ
MTAQTAMRLLAPRALAAYASDMRALLAALLALLLATAANAAEKSVSLKILGWHSKGDAFKTEEAVRGVKGVSGVRSDVPAKRLTVTFDDGQTTSAAILKAVTDAGYTASAPSSGN